MTTNNRRSRRGRNTAPVKETVNTEVVEDEEVEVQEETTKPQPRVRGRANRRTAPVEVVEEEEVLEDEVEDIEEEETTKPVRKTTRARGRARKEVEPVEEEDLEDEEEVDVEEEVKPAPSRGRTRKVVEVVEEEEEDLEDEVEDIEEEETTKPVRKTTRARGSVKPRTPSKRTPQRSAAVRNTRRAVVKPLTEEELINTDKNTSRENFFTMIHMRFMEIFGEDITKEQAMNAIKTMEDLVQTITRDHNSTLTLLGSKLKINTRKAAVYPPTSFAHSEHDIYKPSHRVLQFSQELDEVENVYGFREEMEDGTEEFHEYETEKINGSVMLVVDDANQYVPTDLIIPLESRKK